MVLGPFALPVFSRALVGSPSGATKSKNLKD